MTGCRRSRFPCTGEKGAGAEGLENSRTPVPPEFPAGRPFPGSLHQSGTLQAARGCRDVFHGEFPAALHQEEATKVHRLRRSAARQAGQHHAGIKCVLAKRRRPHVGGLHMPENGSAACAWIKRFLAFALWYCQPLRLLAAVDLFHNPDSRSFWQSRTPQQAVSNKGYIRSQCTLAGR